MLSACSYSKEPTGEDINADMVQGTFRPSDTGMPRQKSYEYPFMGLRAVLPESLLQRMDEKEIVMLSDEQATDDFSAIRYALLSWSLMTKEQKEAEVEKMGMGYFEWIDSLERIGTLGVYQSELVEGLDQLTGCTEHIKLGESMDGTYQYFLSTNSKASKELTDEVRNIKSELTEMTAFQQTSAFAMPSNKVSVTDIGSFSTTDIYGTTYTEKLFAEHNLTMVNVFATWCTPCVQEIPDLEKLHQKMEERGIHVVGIVMDTIDDNGMNQESIDKAKVLAKRTGATYPFLLPDSTLLNGRLSGIDAYPETFFVDKDGKIVGKTYSGSHSLEEWVNIVEEVLDELEASK